MRDINQETGRKNGGGWDGRDKGHKKPSCRGNMDRDLCDEEWAEHSRQRAQYGQRERSQSSMGILEDKRDRHRATGSWKGRHGTLWTTVKNLDFRILSEVCLQKVVMGRVILMAPEAKE